WTQQGNKLVGTGAVGNAKQGSSVALSCNTAIVGGSFDNSTAGAVWAFVAPATTTHDFNGDCLSDIAWYNTTSGQVVSWLVNGTSVISGGSPGSAASPWGIVGQRDFNGDGFADIFWRNGTSGDAVVWLLDGTSVIGGGSLGSAASPWSVAGTGDFNGDGKGDILWYNTNTGQTGVWLLNSADLIGGRVRGCEGAALGRWRHGRLSSGGSPGSAASTWSIAGTGDFNGDGRSDILWYNNTTGQVVIWLLNGTSVIGGGSPGSVAGTWTVAGTGDFNGDGKSDILWYNTS